MTGSPNTAYLLRAANDLARDLGVCAPIRVLIVDDEQDYCLLLRRLMVQLSGVDYQVDIETDPDKAKARMAEQLYDIYIVDQNLGPGITGLDLVADLQREGWHSPFIMVTGSPSHDRHAMSRDCMAYKLKTELSDPETIDRTIRYALKNFWTRECAGQCRYEKPESTGLPAPQAGGCAVAEHVSIGTGGSPAH